MSDFPPRNTHNGQDRFTSSSANEYVANHKEGKHEVDPDSNGIVATICGIHKSKGPRFEYF